MYIISHKISSVSYTHLDVYKRQQNYRLLKFQFNINSETAAENFRFSKKFCFPSSMQKNAFPARRILYRPESLQRGAPERLTFLYRIFFSLSDLLSPAQTSPDSSEDAEAGWLRNSDIPSRSFRSNNILPETSPPAERPFLKKAPECLLDRLPHSGCSPHRSAGRTRSAARCTERAQRKNQESLFSRDVYKRQPLKWWITASSRTKKSG